MSEHDLLRRMATPVMPTLNEETEDLAVERVIRLTLDACGASVHFDSHPFSRMLRDWESYSRHERLDPLLETLGGEDLSGNVAEGPAAFGVPRSFHLRRIEMSR